MGFSIVRLRSQLPLLILSLSAIQLSKEHRGDVMTIEQAILETLKVLPPEKQQEILEFAESLVEGVQTEGADAQAGWENDPFVGMWKDREDMQDSVAWVMQLRRQQWQRSTEPIIKRSHN